MEAGGMKHVHRLDAASAAALIRLRAEDGQGLVEYGLLLLLVSIAAIATLQLIGLDALRLLEQASTAVPL
jgi:Flp pilus assembly pilin Flp